MTENTVVNNTASMTPYQIRLELLKLAESILCNHYSRLAQEVEWQASAERGSFSLGDSSNQIGKKDPSAWTPVRFPTYLADEVVKQAAVLNEFVSSK